MAVVLVKHAKVAQTPNDHSSEVGSDEWNAAHTIAGLENVDNTSDVNKPVSTAQAAAIATGLAGKASLGANTFTGSQQINGVTRSSGSFLISDGVTDFAGFGSEASILGGGGSSTTKAMFYSSTAAYRFFGLGAGFLITDASGNLSVRVADPVSVKDFGAVCDGVADDKTAINNALAAFSSVSMPQGTIKVSGALLMSRANQKLVGAGRNITYIVGSSASGPIIQITGGTASAEIGNLTLDRSAVATSTGHGIQQIGSLSQGMIYNVEAKNQYNGLVLSGVSYGSLRDLVLHDNYNHGMLLAGSASAGGTLQWNIDGILSQANNGDGIQVTSFDNTNMVLGEPWRNITTFANSGYGIRLAGSATAFIADIIINGGFIGSDGLGAIYLDTFSPNGGVQTLISNIQIENVGGGLTGRGVATAATHSGHGIQITANNRAVNLTGISTNGVSNDGIISAGPCTVITNSTITGSGTGGSGSRNGIEITAGSAIITNVSTGNDGGTSQQNGIVLGAASSGSVVANCNVSYKSGSVVAGIVNSSSAPLSNNIIGNIGYAPMQLAVSNLTLANSTAATTVAPVLRLDSNYAAFDSVATLDFTLNGSASQIIGRIGGAIDIDNTSDLVLYANTNFGSAATAEAFRVVGKTGSAVSRHPTGGVGYGIGAGGTVTQATSKATGVTLSKASGQITMNAAALAAGTIVSFVLTNTAIAATDVLILNHISGGTPGSYSLNARCAAGSATIDVRNNTAGSLSEAIVIQYALLKAVTS